MKRRTALAVMARYPEVGKVKTRLARTIGSQRACQLYRAFLSDIAVRFASGPRELVWFYEPPGRDFATVVGAAGRCLPQAGRGLGERMRNGFRVLLEEGFERVLTIGADVPHISEACLDEADESLDSADLVLGPAADGGYYLIALRQPHDVFTGVGMGTSSVLAATLAKARALGLRIHLLPLGFDIDEEEDVGKLRQQLHDEVLAGQLAATAAVLRQWE
jgi:rSAM/selenodomain-associated transferase 1